jgi:hypothetical protein
MAATDLFLLALAMSIVMSLFMIQSLHRFLLLLEPG